MPKAKTGHIWGFWWYHPPVGDGTKDGIARAFSWILKESLRDPRDRAVIATPIWARPMLLAVLQECQIPLDRVTIVASSRKTSFLIRFATWRYQRSRKSKKIPLTTRFRRWSESLYERARPCPGTLYDRALSFIVTARSFLHLLVLVPLFLAAAVLGLLLLLVALVLSFLAVPLIVLGVMLLLARWVLMSRRVDPFRHSIQRIRELAHIALLERVKAGEERMLVRKASCHTEVDCWLVAWPVAENARNLPKPLIVILWDFVFHDFPVAFPPLATRHARQRFQNLLSSASVVVTNSEYVRDRHAVQLFGIPPERTRIIRVAPPDYSRILADRSTTDLKDRRSVAAQLIRDFVRRQLEDVHNPNRQDWEYLRDFPFEEVTFLFNSTQIRPHKNCYNLFRAFELLLRQRYMSIKLFITGNVERQFARAEYDFLRDRALSLDIVSVPRLPTDIHAAFYTLAALSVTPTLFEGGFPFPFMESVSVGTPIVMSDIPQVREVVPDELARDMLFDPFDVNDIADRIVWGLDNREALLARQKALHASMSQFTPEYMGRQYVALMKQLAADGRLSPALSAGATEPGSTPTVPEEVCVPGPAPR